MSLPRKIMEQCRLCPTQFWSKADFAMQNHVAFILCPQNNRASILFPTKSWSNADFALQYHRDIVSRPNITQIIWKLDFFFIFQSISPLGWSFLWVDLSICLCVCLCVWVYSLLRYHLNVFLPPLAKVGCPKVFEIWNHLGNKLEEVVSYLKYFTNKECKIAAQKEKNVFFWRILPYRVGFFWYWCFSFRLTVFLPPLPKVQFSNFLDFWNPLGKVKERSGLKF